MKSKYGVYALFISTDKSFSFTATWEDQSSRVNTNHNPYKILPCLKSKYLPMYTRDRYEI